MKKFTSLALAAALTPALTLGISTVALADTDHDGAQGGEGAGEQSLDEQSVGSQSRGADRDSDGTRRQAQGAGRDRDDAQEQAQGGEGAGEQSLDEQSLGSQSQGADRDSDGAQRQAQGRADAGEQHLSSKPQGAVYADEIIGQSVQTRSTDKNFGKVTDLVIGQDGRIVGVIVSTGGFLGLGERNVALPWDRIHHSMEDDEMAFSIDMDEDQLKDVPKYERNE
jgi:hypothetical protein